MKNAPTHEISARREEYLGSYHEIAVRVRDLLKCDYALVAMPEKDSIRVQAIAGVETDPPGNLVLDAVSKLRDWTPVVIDDSRLIAVPVLYGQKVLGLLAGYSLQPGTFSETDLEKLTAYSHVAAGMIEGMEYEPACASPSLVSTNELLHFSRLITMGQLSACFAHEVNNPLTLIQGHLRFVGEALPENHPLRTNLEVIDRASRRIGDMAKRMLDFSRKRTSRTEPCDVGELIAEALRFVQPSFRTQFVEVEVHAAPRLPLIEADRWQMIQAIVNLLQNATDSMAGLARKVLSIDLVNEPKAIRIAISDTGTGIASAHLPLIFMPFFTTKGERGTGLGLYITKKVIEEHDGLISVDSGSNGTTFTISLPH